MPELPEVEIVKRGLDPVLSGNKILSCVLNRPNLRYPFGDEFKNIVENQKVSSQERRGKYILIHLDNGYSMIWHLGMSGRVKIFDHADDYAPEKHDHVVFAFESGACVAFNDARRFGFLKLVKSDKWAQEVHFSKMGPEPLGNHFNGEILAQALRGKSSSIKQALLDQRVVAGVGNIYACEALYMSRIHPEKAAGKISKPKIEELARAIREVLQTAIDAGGSSLKDYKHTDGSLGYFQHMFNVYNREGKPCPICLENAENECSVARIVQGGRSTFYCPTLQKK